MSSIILLVSREAFEDIDAEKRHWYFQLGREDVSVEEGDDITFIIDGEEEDKTLSVRAGSVLTDDNFQSLLFSGLPLTVEDRDFLRFANPRFCSDEEEQEKGVWGCHIGKIN